MSQSGYTPIQLYRTTTASAVPTAGNLAAGELAINTTDEKLYFKNAAGTVKLLAANVTPVANGGTGTSTAFTAGSIVFAGASGTYSQDNARLFWDGTNNRLGIGTATPTVPLDVVGQVNATGSVVIASGQQYRFGTGGVRILGDTTSDYMAFFTAGGTERMRLDSSGNLGIGTTAASYKLDVRGGISVSSTAAGSAPANGGYFGVSSSGLFMSSTGSNPLSFAIGGTERAWLNATGNYVVGASNDDNVNSGVGIKLRANSTGNPIATVSASSTNAAVGLSMYSTGAAAYRFYVSWDGKINCTSTTIAAISDVRMKENIRDLDYGLDTILALKPRRFDWKAGKGKDTKNDIGFIAQEAELVMPEMVGSWLPGPGDPEDLKSLSAAELIPVFVKAIQELTARVAQLEAQK